MPTFTHGRFSEPIDLPDGSRLTTVGEALCFIEEMPADERLMPHWQAAKEHLLIAAEKRGWLFVGAKLFREALDIPKFMGRSDSADG